LSHGDDTNRNRCGTGGWSLQAVCC